VFILVSLLLNSAVFGHSKFNLCVFQALLLFSQAKDSKNSKNGIDTTNLSFLVLFWKSGKIKEFYKD